MSDVSLAGAFLAGLVSFLSPCVLPLVPGYISMLSGIGMEQLRKGELPRSGLFGSSLAFVAGFSAVFISFGASASAVGSFLRQNRSFLAPIAGALILLFGLHLLGLLIKLTLKTGLIIGVVLVVLGVISLLRHEPLFAGFGAMCGYKVKSGSLACGAHFCWDSLSHLAGHRASGQFLQRFWRSRRPATRSLGEFCCWRFTPRDWRCRFC